MLSLSNFRSSSSTSPLVRINPDTDIPPPRECGLPEKFVSWRDQQADAISRILAGDKRFIVLSMPVGAGKSAVITGAALLSGRRCGVLTMTRGLQDQYAAEMAECISDIRGLANYACPIAAQLGVPAGTTAADAPCQCGYSCRLKWGGCGYYDRYRAAQHADLFCTNYSCWMYDSLKESEQTGNLQFGIEPDITKDRPVSVLFCDEAHEIVSALGMFVGIDVTRRECLQLHLPWPDAGGTVGNWREWAEGNIESVSDRLKAAELRVRKGSGSNGSNGSNGWSRELKHLRDMYRKLERLSAMQLAGEWIITETDKNESAGTMSAVRFDPLNPARYAESALFRGIEKVVLVSATVRPKTASMLGIAQSDMEFIEYPSTFPVARRPVIHIPTIRMTYRNEQDDGLMSEWLKTLDAWIGPRIALGRKGIVHAVSYARMKFIVDNSEYAWCMMTHGTWDRERRVAEFRRADGPCVLVSPSIGTGYDFAHGAARWQVIAKLPFASTQDPMVRARQERDKDYGLYQAAQDLQQATGRINRAESDWGETLILDQSVEWAIPKMRAKGFLSRSWLEAFRSYDTAPEPVNFPE
jgi:Rad3-related DNA helicase